MKAKANGIAFTLQTYEDRLNNNNNSHTNELSQKLTERLSNLQNGDTLETKRLTLTKASSVSATPPPPPPPPQKNGSINNGSFSTPNTPTCSSTPSRTNTLKNTKPKPKAPPVPTKYSVLSYNQSQSYSQNTQSFNQPPPCPTPDYDTLSLASTTSSSMTAAKSSPSQKILNDAAEMESIESFRLNNPTDVKPRPPNTYFQKRNLTGTLSNQSTSSNTSTIRKARPVSVTIGEYPSMRRQPGKLDFLQNGTRDGLEFRKDESLGSRLTSELTQTLNRSNLRKRTESMANSDQG